MSYSEPFKQRVIEEKEELTAKIAKLKQFISTDEADDLDIEDKHHLTLQLNVMLAYLMVLNLRIQKFTD